MRYSVTRKIKKVNHDKTIEKEMCGRTTEVARLTGEKKERNKKKNSSSSSR
jgi:hypothetical protein